MVHDQKNSAKLPARFCRGDFSAEFYNAVKFVQFCGRCPDNTVCATRGRATEVPTRQERFGAKAFDIENQLIRVDLYRKGEWS